MGALNENIKKFRELRHMTQKQFSERLNKSRNVISNWERGENSPDPDTIEQICKILSVTPNHLFGWEPCPDYERYLARLKRYQNEIGNLEEQKRIIEDRLSAMKDCLRNEMNTEE